MIIGWAGSSRWQTCSDAFGPVALGANGSQNFGNLEAKIPSMDGRLGCRLQLLGEFPSF